MPTGVYPRPPKIKKKCVICKKVFYVKNCLKSSKCCSLICRNIWLKTHNKPWPKGKKHTKKEKEKIRLTKLGINNPNWKGNEVGLSALHSWGHRHIPKPKFCQNCKKVLPYDLANISQKYKRNITDWEWLCRKCHMTKDGRMNNLKQFKINNRTK